ncbi:MAG TPA: DNA methyltransferase [Massilibacterium sp.]|nr:DNA methyltransferase [Massilibacterium sp.]
MDNRDFMNQVDDNYYGLAICDPEYGIGMDNSNKRTKPSRPNSYTMYPDFRYKETDWDSERVDANSVNEVIRISKNQILWGANYYCNLLPDGYGWIYWNKKNGDDNCFSDGEFAFSSKGVQSRHFECSAFNGLRGGKDRIHPTEKPQRLYKWLLRNYAEPNQKIFDGWGGSMSIAIACWDLGFDLDIIELDEDYFNDAVKRFEQHISQTQMDF